MIGADAFRACSATRTGLDANEIVASILIERIAGFLSALLLGLLSLVLFFLYEGLDHRFYIVWWLGSVMLVGATVVFAASSNQSTFDLLHGHLLSRFQDTQIVQRLRQFHTIYRAYRHDKGSLAVFCGLTFSEQFIAIPLMWLVARGLGIEVGFLSVAGVVPLAFLISQFPISINGLGVFDGAFMLLMSFIGVPGVEASAIVILGRILETASWLPWWGAQVFSNTTR